MDTLELALSLELDLEKYYREQAKKHKDNNLKVVFTLLAEEEEKHAGILMGKADLLTAELKDEELLTRARELFQGLGDVKSDIKDVPSQLESYRFALEMEHKSLDFYKGLKEKAGDEQTKTTYSYLIHQEDIHCIVLEELVKLTTRPEEWVESAEFGVREDY
ncbi:rubrerythrin [Anaerocolumna cellulosilytica]|uniref:Rubrerythrin n=1 Tax=Anaerocolumna cellulosilytica TaxID=433286 RepID=A0A6S6RD96_9FIRM|nr:ferritin family protein [Anaerocolumna cellulosilytica]MBB5195218.1 rubrerythrin [Anaerocolumna cellulosilytica]BCJ96691.1 rubrerythrin [Anaerocolumna cellulosilytica]